MYLSYGNVAGCEKGEVGTAGREATVHGTQLVELEKKCEEFATTDDFLNRRPLQ